MVPMSSWYCVVIVLWLLVNNTSFVSGDGSDWVSVGYIVQVARQPESSSQGTEKGLQTIIRGADRLVGKGPWSITNEESVLPPSKNPHDYLSWAPYHWPDCRWCSVKAKAEMGGDDPSNQPVDDKQWFAPAGDARVDGHTKVSRRSPRPRRAAHRRPMVNVSQRLQNSRRKAGVRRRDFTAESKPTATVESTFLSVNPVQQTVTASQSGAGRLSPTASAASQAHAEAVTKTTKATTCTPSPTTSMAPSATWTSCPYVGRDGKVNPDVRTLNGPSAINNVGQYSIYGSIAFATKRTTKYSQDVVNAIDYFFLNPDTKMNPNVNYGQIVRGEGPKGKKGTFTGVLDIRGVVKVINSIFILKSGGSADWTNTRDQGMRDWILEYSTWLQESDIGKVTATRPNNHVSFYVAQLAASKYYAGDKPGAVFVLQSFFKKEFRDQIAASGEQPFEGVRAKPVHYRSFNLEALIMNAKLGDALGVDFWTAKSKYGATIQTALDYAITVDPKGEDVGNLLPHVAAVAAAYGDPVGKYKGFLSKHLSTYESKPFWFYNQPGALTKSPTAKTKRSIYLGGGEDDDDGSEPDDGGTITKPGEGASDGGPVNGAPKIPFTCPDAFEDTTKVEIDNGIFVTCEQLRPLYEAEVPGVVA